MHSSGSGIPQKLIHAYAPAGHWNPPPSPVQQERACIMPGQQMKSQITTTATVQGADRLVQRAVKHQRFPAPPPPRPRPHPKMLSSAEGLARSGPEASLQHRVCNARCRSRGRHGGTGAVLRPYRKNPAGRAAGAGPRRKNKRRPKRQIEGKSLPRRRRGMCTAWQVWGKMTSKKKKKQNTGGRH